MKKTPLFPIYLLFIAMLIGYTGQRITSVSEKVVNTPFPKIEFQKIEGHPLLTNDIIKDNDIQVVIMFSSWCPPCQKQEKILAKIKEQTGIKIAGINVHDEYKNIKDMLDKQDYVFDYVGIDKNLFVAKNISGKGSIPQILILDKNQNVVYIRFGLTSEKTWNEKISPLLKQ